MRRRTASLLLPCIALAALIGATAVAAGGMAVITVTDVPADPPAGEETAIGFTVMQHGVTPVSWPRITVVATDAASGAVVRAEASAEGPTGAYVATIVFPTAGDWTLTFDSTDLFMEGSTVLRVAPGVAAPPAAVTPGTPVAIADAAPAPDMTPALIALLVGVLMLAAGLLLRGRRGTHETPVTART